MDKNTNRYTSEIQFKPYTDSMWEGQITVSFSYAHNGWILLWVASTAFVQSLTIFTSDVFDPYVDMFHWLEKIADNQLPAELRIDEEGTEKGLVVQSWDGDILDFQIIDLDTDEKAILLRFRVNRQQLISEFVNKFELFIGSYYKHSDWAQGRDLAEIELSNLHQYLSSIKEE